MGDEFSDVSNYSGRVYGVTEGQMNKRAFFMVPDKKKHRYLFIRK